MRTSYQCGLLIDVVFLSMRSSYRCGLLIDAVFLSMRSSCQCGILINAVFLSMRFSYRCSLPIGVISKYLRFLCWAVWHNVARLGPLSSCVRIHIVQWTVVLGTDTSTQSPSRRQWCPLLNNLEVNENRSWIVTQSNNIVVTKVPGMV